MGPRRFFLFMPAAIRRATPDDTDAWIQLVKTSLGEDHPAKKVFDSEWVRQELDEDSGHETWVAEDGGQLTATATIFSSLPRAETIPI